MGITDEAIKITIEPEAFKRRLELLVRSGPRSLAAYLNAVDTPVAVTGTKAICHCYHITCDSNGQIGLSDLIDLMVEHLIPHAIPRTVIAEALEHAKRTGNPYKIARLQREAEDLFTHIANTGEGGELLLFVLVEQVLRIPQILCKMHLKTSAAHHYHGSDGVHANFDPSSRELLLWWGESKIYNTATRAIYECFKSLAPFLSDPEDREAARGRDMLLLRDKVDLADPELEAALRNYFVREEEESRKVRYCGVGLVGFDSSAYPSPPTKAVSDEVLAAVRTASEQWRGQTLNRLAEEKLESFDIHLFLLPLPSADAFRELFLKALGAVVLPTKVGDASEGDKAMRSAEVKA